MGQTLRPEQLLVAIPTHSHFSPNLARAKTVGFLLFSLLAGCAQTSISEASSEPNSAEKIAFNVAPIRDSTEPLDTSLSHSFELLKEKSAETSPVLHPSIEGEGIKPSEANRFDAPKVFASFRSVVVTELNAEGDSLLIKSVEPKEPEATNEASSLSMLSRAGASKIDTSQEAVPLAVPARDFFAPASKVVALELNEARLDRENSRHLEPAAERSKSQKLTLQGLITGLTQPGLVLTDMLGNLLRPQPLAKEFQFNDGQAYLSEKDNYQLVIVRHPLGQRCQLSRVKTPQHAYKLTCSDKSVAQTSKGNPLMRDCFQITTKGASFTLGYEEASEWIPFAEVSLEPIGVNREQHKTFVHGRLVLESIVHLPLVSPIANIEWLSFDPGMEEGGATQRTGKSGGMPLDLKVGEARSFTVTSSILESGLVQAKVSVKEQKIKLLGIGALNTKAGRFPLACHMEEVVHGSERTTQSWYAPGFGVVKAVINLPGNKTRTLETIEIQARPE